jgi:hypothetical protein
MTAKKWTAVNIDSAEDLGVFEFLDDDGQWQTFDVVATEDKLVFGGTCNVCLLQSGYIEREEGESLDDTIAELIDDIKTYYNDGPSYVSRIVCNERM